jgi:hypothetical protein
MANPLLQHVRIGNTEPVGAIDLTWADVDGRTGVSMCNQRWSSLEEGAESGHGPCQWAVAAAQCEALESLAGGQKGKRPLPRRDDNAQLLDAVLDLQDLSGRRTASVCNGDDTLESLQPPEVRPRRQQ